MTSGTYTRHRRSTKDGRTRPSGGSFAIVVVLSCASTALLLILAFVYWAGSAARIAGLYTAIASPANRALSSERSAYNRDRLQNLAAARSDVLRERKTITSFDDQFLAVTFPSAAATASEELVKADRKLRKLIDQQVHAPTLRRMRSLDPSVRAAAAAVQTQTGRIRQALGLPRSTGPLY